MYDAKSPKFKSERHGSVLSVREVRASLENAEQFVRSHLEELSTFARQGKKSYLEMPIQAPEDLSLAKLRIYNAGFWRLLTASEFLGVDSHLGDFLMNFDYAFQETEIAQIFWELLEDYKRILNEIDV